MSNSYLWQYGFSTTTHARSPPSSNEEQDNVSDKDLKQAESQLLSATMACKEEITLFCDLEGTLIGSIDIADFCEVETDSSGNDTDKVCIPYALRTTWRALLAQRVIDDLVIGHPKYADLKRLFVTEDKAHISRLTNNGAAETCGRASSFRRKMATSIADNTTFRVSLRLLPADMSALGLQYRSNLTPPSRFGTTALPSPPTPILPSLSPAPPPAPNKLDVNDDMDLKYFNIKSISGLARVTDIQRWYNVLHSRGRVCGVYTVPWERFTKLTPMGTTWNVATLNQNILDRQDLMSSAIHCLLSAPSMFTGDCSEFAHLTTNSQGNGYLALYQIVRLVHPLLGQTTTQPQQPQQKRHQHFSEHISHYLDYFQTEACSGRFYSLNERVILIISRLHIQWRDAMKRRYLQLVPQNGTQPQVPLECCLEMLSVTLTQWCADERLDAPSVRSEKSEAPVFVLDDAATDFDALADDLGDTHLHESSSTDLIVGSRRIPAATVDNAVAHMVCYVDRGGATSSYPKCEACGLPGHKAETCHPLVNFCVAQAMAAQHPDLVRRIKAAYKQFPRNQRARTPRKATVKQLVAVLDLPAPPEDFDPSCPSDPTDVVTCLDVQDPALFHCRIGTALVTYRDQDWYTLDDESPLQSFKPVAAPFDTCAIFTDDSDHLVSRLHTGRDMLIDSGSTITTQGTAEGLISYVAPSKSGIRMRSATGQVVSPEGEGALPFPINGGQASLSVMCQHTPAISSSIFSPAETCDTLDYDSYALTCNRRDSTSVVRFTKSGSPDIVLHGSYKLRMPYISLPSSMDTVHSIVPMSYSFPSVKAELLSGDNDDAVHQVLRLIHSGARAFAPTPATCRDAILLVFCERLSDDWLHGGLPVAPVLHVSDAVNRTLWHMRTCHPNPERLVLFSKINKGVPRLKHPQSIEKCSDCLVAKMRKAARGQDRGFVATTVGQGLALDVGFMFGRSKDKARAKRLEGINGGNAYCLIYDFKSELIFGVTMSGKTIPVTWLHLLLTRIAPRGTPGRIVRLDLGGETGKNPTLAALFVKHNYIMQPTGAGASSQNGSGERPHSSIGNAVRAMLYSAKFSPKYWEYAFYMYLRVHTVMPHGANTISPFHSVMGYPADVERLRTFGCVIYALATTRREAKLTTDNINHGKLLGYGGSMKTFIYENVRTKKICRATHARFDEAQLSARQDRLTPNSRALWGALHRSPGSDPPDIDEILTPPDKFCVFADDSPFLQVHTLAIATLCSHDAYGLLFETDPSSRRNIVVDVVASSSCSRINWPKRLQFHTVIQVEDIPVYTVAEVKSALWTINVDTQTHFKLIVAPYRPEKKDQESPVPQVALDQLRVVHHVVHGWTLDDPVMLVTSKNADNMATGTTHTRRTCLQGPEREKWLAAEYDMLDKNDSYGMYGKPTSRAAIPHDAKVVRPIWNYSQKGSGIHKDRKCMNGKQLVRIGVKFSNTYAACMEQHCLRLFVALSAYLGCIIEDGDVVNAYAHASAEGTLIYIAVDEVFQSWYNARYGSTVSLGDCIPLHKGMQGHPQAGQWWEKHFDTKCAAPLRLRPSFMEPTMYRCDDDVVSGPTLAIRQVDDILCAAASASDRAYVLNGIASTVTFKISPEPTTLFYATDIEQTAAYIRIYAKSYIDSCLIKLGWAEDSKDSAVMVPLTPSTVKEMATSRGPLDPDALKIIVARFGFEYRSLTGMLIFAVQIGRFDIGPAVSILCKYNDRPDTVHFQAAKTVMRYLRRTRDRGLIYWRPTGKERSDLPRGTLTPMRPESGPAELFPSDHPLLEPVCYVDASYAGLLVLGDPRSITGIVIMLGGTAIFAKTRIQRTTALSSTEAEIIAGCDAGKVIKYFRQVFTDLRLTLTGPTPTGEDNEGTIAVASHRSSSGRTRHMDIQYFATQEWTRRGILSFFKIHGTVNPSDAMSKVLYRILHRRHFDRAQGYYGSPHATHATYLPNPDDNPTPG